MAAKLTSFSRHIFPSPQQEHKELNAEVREAEGRAGVALRPEGQRQLRDHVRGHRRLRHRPPRDGEGAALAQGGRRRAGHGGEVAEDLRRRRQGAQGGGQKVEGGGMT